MNAILRYTLALATVLVATQAAAQVVFYEEADFKGRTFTTTQPMSDFRGSGFNNRATSMIVRGDRWEVCEEPGFNGRCAVLGQGRYPSLAAVGLNDRISSVRMVNPRTPVDMAPTPVTPKVTFYEDDDFKGRSFVTQQAVGNFQRFGFNNRARSAIVQADLWEVCDEAGFRGRCVILRQGRYPSLAMMGMSDQVSSVRVLEKNPSIVTFYESEDFKGRSFVTKNAVENFSTWGYNDRASSVIVRKDLWEVCSEGGYRGRCVVLRQGRYPSLAAMGLNDRVTSVRPVPPNTQVSSDRYAPPPPAAYYDYNRRNNERLYAANVTSVRAVAGTPEQRCWVEQQQIGQQQGAQGQLNVPGAIIGGVIGGILGHQVGGGSGKDIATVGGVVAGAAIGANVGRDRNGQPYAQNVQRCENTVSQTRPDYWDVTYNFRGREHRMQMSSPPGPTITVNEQGEPRT